MSQWVLENGYFRLQLDENGKIELKSRNNSRVWRSDAPFRFTYGDCYSFDLVRHCRMKVVQKENSLQINFDRLDWIARFAGHKYRKPDPGPDFKFSFKIELIEDEIIFTTGKIRNMDDEPCTIEFPFRLLEWDKSEKIDFVNPRGYGLMVQFPRPDEFFQSRWGYFGMPVYGVFEEQGGIGVQIVEPFDHSNFLNVGTFHKDRASVHSSWHINKRFSDYVRHQVWKYLPAGSDFVTLAKLFRLCFQVK